MDIINWNKEANVESDSYRLFRVVDTFVIVRKTKNEWQTSRIKRSSSEGKIIDNLPDSGNSADLPKSLQWKRWEAGEGDSRCKIMPAFPPLPVMSHPMNPIHLPPGARAVFFIGVPAYIEVWGQCYKRWVLLDSFPTEEFPYTWRGALELDGKTRSTTRGSVCVSLQTNAKRQYTPETYRSYSIICAVEISNHRSTPLPLYQIPLDTSYLSIHLGEQHAWASYCRFDMYDLPLSEGVLYHKRPPKEAGTTTRLSDAQKVWQKHEKTNIAKILLDRVRLSI